MDEFERVSPWLEAALEYSGGTHTIEDVEQAVRDQRMLLISDDKCAMVFEVIVYPRLKVLHGFLCGGDLGAIKDYDQRLVELAKALGCGRLSVAGRMGWARALTDIGFKPTCTVVSKDIMV